MVYLRLSWERAFEPGSLPDISAHTQLYDFTSLEGCRRQPRIGVSKEMLPVTLDSNRRKKVFVIVPSSALRDCFRSHVRQACYH